MKKDLILICAITALAFVSKLEAKGRGRSGGRRGGSHSGSHGGGHGGGFWSFFGGSKKSSISSGSHSPHSPSAYKNSHTGGWFQGFIHPSPYHYSYRPIYIGRSHHSSSSNQGNSDGNGYKGDEQQKSVNTDIETDPSLAERRDNDATDYAIGYTISKALSNEFAGTPNNGEVNFSLNPYAEDLEKDLQEFLKSMEKKLYN